MRVLAVLGTSAGGVGRHVASLVRGLEGRGNEVVVACPRDVGDRFAFDEVATAVAVVEFRDRPHPVNDARAARELRRLASGADVVHAHGLRAAALAVVATARLDVPVVATLHNAAPTEALTRALYSGLERVVARGCDVVLGVSADLVERMDHLGARRTGLAVVPAPPRHTARRDRYDVHAELGIDVRTALVVVVARLAPQKGLDVLLDAHRELVDLDLLTVVAGDGPLDGGLRRRILDEGLPVRLLGPREDVPDLLGAADVVVSSARWEGQPVSLQEALLAGAAIVATDAGGTGAVLGEAGVLVPPGDAAALARGVREVLTHGALRDDLRSRAVARAAELPSEDDAIDAVVEVYGAVVGAPLDRRPPPSEP